MRTAPASLQDYLAADHITVVYEPRRTLHLDRTLEARGLHRRFAVMVPGFGALPAFLRGSPLLATAPSLLAGRFMAGFGSCEVPVPCPPLPMYLIWHRRHQDDAAHRWLRELLASNSPPTA